MLLREPTAFSERGKVHSIKFTFPEVPVNRKAHVTCRDPEGLSSQNVSMAKPNFDWYLREWLETLRVRFPHAWLQTETGWSDGKVSNVLSGKKRYDKDIVNLVSEKLGIQPYELLMSPQLANAIRAMRSEAPKLAAATEEPPMDQVGVLRQIGKAR